jgi:hypothetical protein
LVWVVRDGCTLAAGAGEFNEPRIQVAISISILDLDPGVDLGGGWWVAAATLTLKVTLAACWSLRHILASLEAKAQFAVSPEAIRFGLVDYKPQTAR